MQDRYVGDIGDFANNGLLRALCGTPEMRVDGLKLGVIEYFNKPSTADLEKTGQGNKIEYLKVSDYSNSTYRECDSGLYVALQNLIGESLVSGTELKLDPDMARKLLPVDERYYDALTPSAGGRPAWYQDAIQKVGDANLVFLNPDTGIASEIQERNVPPSHATMAEIKQIFEEGKSLVIYQHLGLGAPTVEHTSERLMQELPSHWKLWAFQWHRISSRAYFIVARTQEHKDTIEKQLAAFRQTPWQKIRRGFKEAHFTLEYPPEGV